MTHENILLLNSEAGQSKSRTTCFGIDSLLYRQLWSYKYCFKETDRDWAVKAPALIYILVTNLTTRHQIHTYLFGWRAGAVTYRGPCWRRCLWWLMSGTHAWLVTLRAFCLAVVMYPFSIPPSLFFSFSVIGGHQGNCQHAISHQKNCSMPLKGDKQMECPAKSNETVCYFKCSG